MLIPLSAGLVRQFGPGVEAPAAMAVNGFTALGRGTSGQINVTIDSGEVPEGTTDIKYQLDGGTAVSSGGTSSFNITSLTNDTIYELALIMSNAGGDSDPTPEIPVIPRATSTTVSSTSDGTGAGTLRNALADSGSRAVIITATGEHTALTQIPVSEANCTIINDSDTHYISGARLQVQSSNVLVHNLTIYAGCGVGSNTRQGDAIVIGNDSGAISNIFAVHCDFQGGIDENASVYADPGTGGAVTTVRFYDCQLAGALTYACHYEGPPDHDFGVQVSDIAHTQIEFIRCFLGYCQFRAPQFSASNGIGAVTDSLIWNVEGNALSLFDGVEVDCAGVRVKRGLYSNTANSMLCDEGSAAQFSWSNCDSQSTDGGSFLSGYGNIWRVRAGGTALVGDGSDPEYSSSFINSNNRLTSSMGASAAETHVLANVGRRLANGDAFAFNQKMLDEYVSGGSDRALDSGDWARAVYGNYTPTAATATAAGWYWSGGGDVGAETADQYTIHIDISGIDAWLTANPAGQIRFIDLFGRLQIELAGSTGRLSGFHRNVDNTARVDWNMTTSIAGTAGRIHVTADMRSGGEGFRLFVDETEVSGINYSTGAQDTVGAIDFGRNALGVLCEDNGASPPTISGINSITMFAADAASGSANNGGLVNPGAFYRGGNRASPWKTGKNMLFSIHGGPTPWNNGTYDGILNSTLGAPTVVGTFS